MLELRRSAARQPRDWPVADLIRDRLNEAGVEVRDGGEGPRWSLEQHAGRLVSGSSATPPGRIG